MVLRKAMAIARILKAEGSDLALIREGRVCIATIGNIDPQSPDYQTYLGFIEHWEKLEVLYGTKGRVNL